MPRWINRSTRRSRSKALAMYQGQWAFGALQRRLDPEWRVLRHLVLTNAAGTECYSIDVALLHEERGIALIVVRRDEYTFADLAIRLARGMLAAAGVFERFPGILPVVFLSVEPRQVPRVPALLLKAFAAAPPLTVSDRCWVGAATETLSAAVAAEPTETWARAEDSSSSDLGSAPGSTPFTRPRPAPRLPAPVRTVAIVGAVGLFLAAATGVTVTFVAAPGSAHDATAGASGANRDLRLLSEEAVAEYLGLRPQTFRARQDALRAAGFPAPEPITGNYDKRAVDRWLDRNAGSR